jgi:hypothetical protein
MRRYIVLLLALCLVFAASMELATGYVVPTKSRIQRRIAGEYVAATRVGMPPRDTVPILIIGNSLLEEGMDVSQLQRDVGGSYQISRFVVENTFYFDWYYGLRHLFRLGSQPKIVVLVISPRQFLSDQIEGDLFAHRLLDARDILQLKSDLGVDNTASSNLLAANVSSFYEFRSEIRKLVLVRLLPDFEILGSKLLVRGKALPSDGEIRATAGTRLRRISQLCREHGSEFVFLIPPTNELRDGAAQLQKAGEESGVKVLVPIGSDQFPLEMYRDGFHLNPRGARIFTTAAAHSLQEVISQR